MALAYLISPAWQYEDINGKPLVGGFLRVYRHGTTTPIATYKDFTGDLNPVDITLNNKGMGIILVDPSYLYDVYCYDRNGVEQWSRLNVCTCGGGDSSDYLDWFKSIGDTRIQGTTIHRPSCTSGTMELGTYGVKVYANRYYHVTAHVDAIKTGISPNYDKFYVRFKHFDGANYTQLESSMRMVDWSIEMTQQFDIDCDVFVEHDGELVVFIDGQDVEAGQFELSNMYVHRVYSGTASIPGGVVTGYDLEAGLATKQDVLIPGANITIENNVISTTAELQQIQTDWAQTDSAEVDYIKNKPNLATVATSGSYNDLTDKPSIPAAQVQSDWAQSDSSAVDYIKNKPSIPAAQVNSDWNASSGVAQILNKPSIPSVDQSYGASSTNAQSGTAVAEAIASVRQVPSTQSSDNGKVLGVTDANGTLGWVAQSGGGGSIPTPIASDVGKVLSVLDAQGNIGWVPYYPSYKPIRIQFEDPNATPNSYYATRVSIEPNVWDVPIPAGGSLTLRPSSTYRFSVIEADLAGMAEFGFLNNHYLTSVSNVYNSERLTSINFGGCAALTSVEPFPIPLVTSLNKAFDSADHLTAIPLFNTQNVRDMSRAFYGCTSITEIPLLDTSRVISANEMFAYCYNVEHGALALYNQMSTQATPPVDHNNTFLYCGRDTVTGAAELAQIPTSWGGTRQ